MPVPSKSQIKAMGIAKAKRLKAARGPLTFVTGDKLIDKKLQSFPIQVQKKLSKKGTREVAKQIVLPDARRHAPRDTGALGRSLKVRALKRSRVRFGHRVVAEHKGGLATNVSESVWFGYPYGIAQEFGSVRGLAENPYLRPAVFATSQVMKARVLYKRVMTKIVNDEKVA